MKSSGGPGCLGGLKNQEIPDYRNRAFVQKLVILEKLGKRKKTGKAEDLKKGAAD